MNWYILIIAIKCWCLNSSILLSRKVIELCAKKGKGENNTFGSKCIWKQGPCIFIGYCTSLCHAEYLSVQFLDFLYRLRSKSFRPITSFSILKFKLKILLWWLYSHVASFCPSSASYLNFDTYALYYSILFFIVVYVFYTLHSFSYLYCFIVTKAFVPLRLLLFFKWNTSKTVKPAYSNPTLTREKEADSKTVIELLKLHLKILDLWLNCKTRHILVTSGEKYKIQTI